MVNKKEFKKLKFGLEQCVVRLSLIVDFKGKKWVLMVFSSSRTSWKETTNQISDYKNIDETLTCCRRY